MATNPEQPKPQDSQKETEQPQPTPEKREPTEAYVERMAKQVEFSVAGNQARILESADLRMKKAPASIGLEQQKAQSVFTAGGFADRINATKEKIVALTRAAKNRIKTLVSSQSKVSELSEIAKHTSLESGIKIDTTPEAAVENRQESGNTPAEQAETQEQKELRELREYLEKEVFSKFGLTAEDEQRILAEAPESKREILQRSFENTRNSLETFYEMETIEGRIDNYAADKAERQLIYDTLAPILENSIAEIQPKLAELGIEVSLATLNFKPETGNRTDLSAALNEVGTRLQFAVRDQVNKKIIQAFTENGEYRGITIPTAEQQKDEGFMEQRGQRLQKMELEEIRAIVDSIGFDKWITQTEKQLADPFTIRSGKSWGEIPQIDANQFRTTKSKEEITHLLEAEKQLTEQTNFLSVNITANKLETVLSKGGFKDIFALTSEELVEMKRIEGRGDDFYFNQRKQIEQALGIYDAESSTVYGTYASENGDDEKRGGADMYGGIFLKLKPGVETVFSEGDSMSGQNVIADKKLSKLGVNRLDYTNHATARQIAPEHAALVKAMSNTYKKIENTLGRGVNSMGYIEAHIKNLKLEDIDSINIPQSIATSYQYMVDHGSYRSLILRLQQDPAWKDKIKIIENG